MGVMSIEQGDEALFQRSVNGFEVEKTVERVNFGKLTDDYSFALIKCLAGYEEAVRKAAERYEPSVIARYLISVTTAFNKFYHECPILKADGDVKNARLLLVELTQKVIARACGLLGIECPEEM